MAELIPPRRNEFLTKEGVPTQRFADYLEKLASYVNTARDDIVFNQVKEQFPWQFGETSDGSIVVVATTNYTTTGFEKLVICNDSIVVSLNDAPFDLEEVSIKRNTDAGQITITGTIDGASDHILNYNYDSIDLIYSAVSGGWLIV